MSREDYPDLVAASAFISDAFRMFESMRRRVFVHVGWEYQLTLPGPATRSGGSLWCVLTSDCRSCNGQHVGLPKTSYIMWKNYMPIVCDHGKKIFNIFVEPAGRKEGEADFLMPQVVKPVPPTGSSLSSGGSITSAKLTQDKARVEARAVEALKHLRAFALQAEQTPPPDFFPELALTEVDSKIFLVEERRDALVNIL